MYIYAHHIVFLDAKRLEPGGESEAAVIRLLPGEFCVAIHDGCKIAVCGSGTVDEGEWGEWSEVCIILG